MTENENKDYIELIEDSAQIRVELDEVIRPRYNALKKIFKRVFDKKPSLFKHVVDMQYYTGGYPKEDSPPKLAGVAEKLGALVQMYEATDKLENLNAYFREFGVEVKRPDGYTEYYNEPVVKMDEKAKKLWDDFVGRDADSGSEILRILIAEALDCQTEICETSDKISVDAAKRAEEDFNLKKGPFMQAVNIKTSDIKKGNGEERLATIDENISNLELAIEPLRIK